jgi:hypothetical protein
MRIAGTFSAVAILVLVAGCPSTSGPSGYPAQVTGIGDSPNYPLRAAGFERAEIMMYEPGFRHISTAYNLRTKEAQIAATIYLVPHESPQASVKQRYQSEKTTIEQYHPGARLMSEETVILSKHGVTYEALRATYELDGTFMHQKQRLHSEVWLWSHKDRYVKFRSTAPIGQKSIAGTKNLELLNAVNWAT